MTRKESLSRPADDLVIYCGEKQLTYASVMSVHNGTGAGGLGFAYIKEIREKPIEDTKVIFAVQEIEIVLRSVLANGGEKKEVLFWGKSSGLRMNIGPSEGVAVEFRQSPYHFGPTIDTPGKEEGGTTGPVRYDGVVFNPTIDGVCRGNRKSDEAPYGFLDPWRVPTPSSRSYVNGRTGNAIRKTVDERDKFWTVRKAAKWLCGEHKDSLTKVAERFIDPPTDKDFELLPDGDKEKPNEVLLRDLRIALGTTLPDALDQLLAPFGYSWCVEYEKQGKRRIRFIERGTGDKKQTKSLLLQKPGEFVDPTKTHLKDLSIGVGYQSLVNKVHVLGSYKRYESTFELKRAWPAELDDTDNEDLSIESLEALEQPDSFKWMAWRNWVLNEAGDYVGTRESTKKPYDFKDVFPEKPTSRRRRFLPCVSLNSGDLRPAGNHRGYEIEWWDAEPEEWRYISELSEGGSVEILTDECGIRFTGMKIPLQIYLAGADAKVRITCSVESDERLQAEYPKSDAKSASIQPDTIPHVINVPQRFLYQKIAKGSKYADNSRVIANEIDDQKQADEFAKRVVDAWDQADVSGTAQISGLTNTKGELEFAIGDVITGTEERKIDLSIGASAAADDEKKERYPQVVGISYDNVGQSRTLHLETFRDARIV